jgi:sporulation protein YlmC with PRC-barrel domain
MEDPEVQIMRAEGQPQVRIEQMQAQQQDQQQAQQAQLEESESQQQDTEGTQVQLKEDTGQTQQMDSQQQAGQGEQPVDVSELEGTEVINEQGEQLGSVSRVVEDTNDGQTYVIIGHGGFLGLGEKEVAFSPDNLTLGDDLRLIVRGMTEEQIADMPAFEMDEERFRELEAEGTINLQTGSADQTN